MFNFSRDNLRVGMHVYSSDDHQIGTISEIGQSHFKCDTGFLGLGKDFWIPFSAITDVRGDRVYLRADKNNLKSMGWDKKPTNLGGFTGGDRY